MSDLVEAARLRMCQEAHGKEVEARRAKEDELREQADLMASVVDASNSEEEDIAIENMRVYMATRWVQQGEGGKLPLARVTG